MMKIILLIGVMDGIGFEVVKMLVLGGYFVLFYGCNLEKFVWVEEILRVFLGVGRVEGYVVDFFFFVDVF